MMRLRRYLLLSVLGLVCVLFLFLVWVARSGHVLTVFPPRLSTQAEEDSASGGAAGMDSPSNALPPAQTLSPAEQARERALQAEYQGNAAAADVEAGMRRRQREWQQHRQDYGGR